MTHRLLPQTPRRLLAPEEQTEESDAGDDDDRAPEHPTHFDPRDACSRRHNRLVSCYFLVLLVLRGGRWLWYGGGGGWHCVFKWVWGLFTPRDFGCWWIRWC